MWFLHKSQQLNTIFHILTLCASYETIYDYRRCDLEETVSVCPHGKRKFYSEPVLILVSFIGVLFALITFTTYFVGIYGRLPNDFFFHATEVNALNTMLGGIVFVLIGCLLALTLKRVKAYSLMALIVFVMLPASDLIPGILNDSYHINVWPLKSLLSWILPLNTSWTIDYQYGISCEGIRWNLVYAWFFFLLACFALRLTKKEKLKSFVLVGISLILCGTNFFIYLQGGSIIDLTLAPTSVFRFDQMYYRENSQQEETAEFSILSYDMDFCVDHRLNAKVTMEIDEANLTNYPFTLYRSYLVNKVTNESGVDIPFIQSGDYIVISPDQPVNYITMEYCGYSPMFYSNDQGVCLPGCFPFYPWAGYRKIYFTEPTDSVSYPANIARVDLPETEFSVSILGVKNVQTNLSQKSDSLNFFGKTNALSIMGGFLSSNDVGGYSVVSSTLSDPKYRFSKDWLDLLQESITAEEMKKGISKHLVLSDYLIFQNNETLSTRAGYGDTIVLGNHMFLQPAWDVKVMAQDIVSQKNDPVILSSDEVIAKMEGMIK